MKGARIAIGAALLVIAPFAATFAYSFVPGVPGDVRVALVPLEDAAPGAVIARRARSWENCELQVEVAGTVRTVSRAELGASVDADAMTRDVERIGHAHDPFVDLPALFAAWSGRIDLAWTVRVDPISVRRFVRELAQDVDRHAAGARFDARGRLLELSHDGLRLDRTAAVRDLIDALRHERGGVVLATETISSGIGETAIEPTVEEPREQVVLSRYSTRYHIRERDRSHNLAVAAGFLDGARIPARGRLSFNDRVGARDRAHGYREAHVILGGEMVDGMGGGVCQVASTLHAAAFLGGFDFVEHVPHSRPSAYIPMGLDATVVWPTVDLVIANPYPFDVAVRAWADGGEMTVELLGARRMREVDWRRTTVDTERWTERLVEDESVADGDEVVTQTPILGYTILRERTIHDAAGVHLEERTIRYPPTDRIVHVPPGTTGVPNNPY
ncbi:MAG: VanW family protein [Sandaracinaceae bacterium]